MSLSLVMALSKVVVFHMYMMMLGENSFITLNHLRSVFCIDFIMSFVVGRRIFIVYITLFVLLRALVAGALWCPGDGVCALFNRGA